MSKQNKKYDGKYAVGDVIVCTNSKPLDETYNTWLTEYKAYRVVACKYNKVNKIAVINDRGRRMWYIEAHFITLDKMRKRKIKRMKNRAIQRIRNTI